MSAYYNEIDPYAAQWLRNLVSAGHIAAGDVDERSITDVQPGDLAAYDQCHFFAGIGGWSYALRLAGWPDDRPVWTGSCPCQPFSAAGAGKAGDDERHLWPAWFSLIKECGPAIVFGEQVEAAIGWGWLDLVFSDLEGEGYACGTAVLPACGVGAPHIRQRLWFVANSTSARRPTERSASSAYSCGPVAQSRGLGELADNPIPRRNEQPKRNGGADGRPTQEPRRLCDAGELAYSPAGGQRIAGAPHEGGDDQSYAPERRFAGSVDNASGERRRTRRDNNAEHERIIPDATGELGNAAGDRQRQPRISETSDGRSCQAGGSSPWRDLEWLPCSDGKARPTRPGIFPLAHGISARVGKLRAAGNAIVPQVAAQFILAASGV